YQSDRTRAPLPSADAYNLEIRKTLQSQNEFVVLGLMNKDKNIITDQKQFYYDVDDPYWHTAPLIGQPIHVERAYITLQKNSETNAVQAFETLVACKPQDKTPDVPICTTVSRLTPQQAAPDQSLLDLANTRVQSSGLTDYNLVYSYKDIGR